MTYTIVLVCGLMPTPRHLSPRVASSLRRSHFVAPNIFITQLFPPPSPLFLANDAHGSIVVVVVVEVVAVVIVVVVVVVVVVAAAAVVVVVVAAEAAAVVVVVVVVVISLI